MKNLSRLLINEPPLQVLPTIAKAIGLNEAIVLQQMHYWTLNKSARGDNSTERDGFLWVYNTYEEWQKTFCFWHTGTIKRIFTSLEKQGLLVSEMYEKSQGNRRKWYRVDYEVLERLDHQSILSRPSEQNAPTMSANCADDKSILHRSYREAKSTTETTPERAPTARAFDELSNESTKPTPVASSKALEWERVKDLPECIAFAEVCQIDRRWGLPRQFWELGENFPPLLAMGATVEHFRNFLPWWYANDWRGKKGDAPKPTQVREVWQAFIAGHATAKQRDPTLDELRVMTAQAVQERKQNHALK